MKETINPGQLEHLEKQVENLSKLVEINGIINSTLNISRLLSIIMEMIKDIMATETSSLLLFDEISNELVFKVALGDAGEELKEKYRVKLGQGIAGWVAQNRKPVIVNDVYNDPRFDSMYDMNTGFVTHSIICSPLLFKGKLIGVIQAINPVSGRGFDEEDMNLFRVFSNQAALAVQNAIFFQRAIEEERITSELTAAKSIQDTLTPVIGKFQEKYTVAARSLPAREVGGGFHFFKEYREGKALLAMGNLEQKGIPGALRASTFSGILKVLVEIGSHKPDEIINKISSIHTGEVIGSSGFSLFIADINFDSGLVKYVNAGDACPLLIRDGKARYLRFKDRSSGYVGDEDFYAVPVSIKLIPGDRFVVLSRSLPEIKSRNGRTLGLSGIMSFLENEKGESCDIIDSLLDYVNNYTGKLERSRDVSVVAFSLKKV
jgi:sigma-B regulation protein RsbU (phosphoserine phosphatase)